MGSFIRNLISRHFEAGKNIVPRLPGRFEPVDGRNGSQHEYAEFHEGPENKPGLQPEMRGHGFISEENQVSTGAHFSVKKEVTPPVVDDNQAHELPARQNFMDDDQEKQVAGIMPDMVANHGYPSGFYEPEAFNTGEKMGNEKKRPLPGIEPILPGNIKPDENDESTAYKESREFNIQPVRSQGAFGEPPGSKRPEIDTAPVFRQDPAADHIIKVSIGQIIVRAVVPSAPVTVQKPKEAHKPVLTLEDYLKQRNKK